MVVAAAEDGSGRRINSVDLMAGKRVGVAGGPRCERVCERAGGQAGVHARELMSARVYPSQYRTSLSAITCVAR